MPKKLYPVHLTAEEREQLDTYRTFNTVLSFCL